MSYPHRKPIYPLLSPKIVFYLLRNEEIGEVQTICLKTIASKRAGLVREASTPQNFQVAFPFSHISPHLRVDFLAGWGCALSWFCAQHHRGQGQQLQLFPGKVLEFQGPILSLCVLLPSVAHHQKLWNCLFIRSADRPLSQCSAIWLDWPQHLRAGYGPGLTVRDSTPSFHSERGSFSGSHGLGPVTNRNGNAGFESGTH